MPTIKQLPATRAILTCQIGFVVLSSFWCPIAVSEELQIEVTGVFIRDEQYGESFGSTESELPFSVSLVIDETQGVHLSGGAPLIDGQPVAEDALVLPQKAVSSVTASLGAVNWNESNLGPLTRSDLGFRPAVILMGDLDGDSVKVFCALVDAEDGMLSLSRLVCGDSDCTLDDGGFGQDFASGSSGSIGNLAVIVTSDFESGAR